MLKKYILVMVMILCLVGCANMRGSGVMITESRPIIGTFNEIYMAHSGDLTVISGPEVSLTIEGEDNLVPLIEASVNGERLTITNRDKTRGWQTTRPLRVRVTMPDLEHITLAGAGDIDGSGFATENLTIAVSGSGDLSLDDLKIDTLQVSLSGAGDIRLAGEADDVTINATGNGTVYAGGLASQQADVNASGSSDIVVWVSEYLKVNITSDTSDVEFYGSARLEQAVTSKGEVVSLGAKR